MLRKKMIREILRNKPQFITILLMVMIGVMVYAGIEAYMDGMTATANRFYTKNNLQDINVISTSFTKSDLDKIKSLDKVNDAERKLTLTMNDCNDDKKSYLVNVIEKNNISKFYVQSGIKFDSKKDGVWLDYFYAKENNIKVGDKISFEYESYVFNEKVNGLIYVPDHVYDVKDEAQIMPNHKTYGFIYMSSKSLEGFVRYQAKSALEKSTLKSISDEEFDLLYPDFNYEEKILYNYILVDVKNKKDVNKVKDEIEKNVESAKATISIEKTPSYAMYKGEIDEGSAYVGIFSGLFLFIAMLSVVTTMTRIIKNEKLQIGTLKALGFSMKKIVKHYVGYGFWVSLVGAILGTAFGLVVALMVITGADPSGATMLAIHPIITISACILKGTFAGLFSALVFNALKDKNKLVAIICASAIAPITNTGILALVIILFFDGAFVTFISLFITINFAIELLIDLLLSPALLRIIDSKN